MASLNEIAYNIKNLAYGGGSTTGEETIGIRQIKFWIHYYRAQILKEEVMNGKGVNQMYFQEIAFTYLNDVRYNYTNSDGETPWKDYLEDNSNTISKFIVYSKRTANEAGLSNPTFGYDHYGRDFYDLHTYVEYDDYGYISVLLPRLIHVDGFGIKNLQIRKAYEDTNQNTSTLNLPVVNETGGGMKKYSRFTKLSPVGYISLTADNRDNINIGPLKSYMRGAVGGYDQPFLYRLYADGIYADPTDHINWNDDLEYPLPDYAIADLNRRILTQEMGIILQTRDDRIDDNIDSTNVQQEVQRQVPSGQRRTR